MGADDYGADYILCMRALGLSTGIGDGNYGPDRELTRGQMASFLVRLWRALNMTCPEGDTPFTDVTGSVHEDSITCLYNLGITKGATATTYGPGRDLTASQISRFLLRMFESHGSTCVARESELEEAIDCLLKHHVIPSPIEVRSNNPVTRAQMAVYVIGLWYNMAGHGLPPDPRPKPAGPGDRVIVPENSGNFTGRLHPGKNHGTIPVHVHYCAQEGRYTSADLTQVVRLLNEEVSPRWSAESSNRMHLDFVAGSIVSPELPWGTVLDAHNTFDVCEEKVRGGRWDSVDLDNFPDSFDQEVLLLVDAKFEGIDGLGGGSSEVSGPGGSYQSGGTAMSRSMESLSDTDRFLFVVSHELGHSILGLGHDYFSCGHPTLMTNFRCGTIRCTTRSIVGTPDFTVPRYLGDGLFMSCHHRKLLGWAIGGTSPPCAAQPPAQADFSVSAGDEQITVD